ncbi:hypothetical protein [Spongiactinospora gelatinilytica]|uniref:hypothetical protein n=1 Tax=Spongiactinospora gelatinilytica TaxID=2666298 RepID=UPI0018F2ED0A
MRELVTFPRACRAEYGLADRPFDVVTGGSSPSGPAGRDIVGPLADAGITWRDERLSGEEPEQADVVLRHIGHGPPLL